MPKKQDNEKKVTPKKKTQTKKIEKQNNEIKEDIVNNIEEENISETKIEKKKVEDDKLKLTELFDGNTSLKELALSLKIISVLFNIINVGVMILIISFGIYSIIQTTTLGIDEISKDESILSFVALANTSSVLSPESLVLSYKSNSLFLFIEIILPTVIISITLGSLFLFWKYVYKIASSAKSNEKLFSKRNLELLKRMKDIATLSFIIILCLCGFELIILWVIVVIIMEVIYYIFDYAVNKK